MITNIIAESKAEVDLTGCCCAVDRIKLVPDYAGESALRGECNNLFTLHFDLSCYFCGKADNI